jgi:hypothetical protein
MDVVARAAALCTNSCHGDDHEARWRRGLNCTKRRRLPRGASFGSAESLSTRQNILPCERERERAEQTGDRRHKARRTHGLQEGGRERVCRSAGRYGRRDGPFGRPPGMALGCRQPGPAMPHTPRSDAAVNGGERAMIAKRRKSTHTKSVARARRKTTEEYVARTTATEGGQCLVHLVKCREDCTLHIQQQSSSTHHY